MKNFERALNVALILSVLFLFLILFLRESDHLEESQEVEVSKNCTRENPYKLEPEFSRAVSIIKQKFDYYGDSGGFLDEFENCLNIDYADLSEEGAEGMFYFDEETSYPNNLTISVDRSYQQKDDYLTAVLLVHEITHARQFYTRANIGCIDMEQEAFWNEFLLLRKFNTGEKAAILSRMYNPLDYPSSDPSIRGLEDLMDIINPAAKMCTEGDGACIQSYAAPALRKSLEESDFYKKQCNLS